jgi:hypothetical protein
VVEKTAERIINGTVSGLCRIINIRVTQMLHFIFPENSKNGGGMLNLWSFSTPLHDKCLSPDSALANTLVILA